MHKITVITPPDKIFNQDYSFLLIYPSSNVKEQFQRAIAYLDIPITVYYYEPEELDANVDWLLSVAKITRTVILDLDNCPPKIRQIAAYILSNSNTYWLTNSNDNYYNKLSVNQVYNLDFIQQLLGDYIEAQKELCKKQ